MREIQSRILGIARVIDFYSNEKTAIYLGAIRRYQEMSVKQKHPKSGLPKSRVHKPAAAAARNSICLRLLLRSDAGAAFTTV
ncbi:hypothetical protein TNCT_248641 [Trichonephila clavata]|uniref:Uncharacterized protein n=1 Tax=Trichonephila clavata TaxID=2740835 RepID=A0A8X6I8F2_TRICU|nr:hypothetical protein TNCT_248641 [Trichonephila clavata]